MNYSEICAVARKVLKKLTGGGDTIDPKFIPGAVEIDLLRYGIEIASMAIMGGGYVDLEDVGSFWDDVNTQSPIVLSILVGENTKMMTYDPGKVIDISTQRVLAIGFYGLAITNAGTMKLAVAIARTGNGKSAKVTVELL